MLKNYLLVSIRNLIRHRSFSFVNIFGLALGIACFVVIALYISDELSYDNFHQNKERIFRIAGEYDQGGDSRNKSAQTTYLLQRALDAAFPELPRVVRIDPRSALLRYQGRAYQENRVIFADPEFFDLFTFELVSGDSKTALADPNSVVMSVSAARKYFADAEPLGALVDFNGQSVKVTGLMADMPENSHFYGDMIFSMTTMEPFYPRWVLENATGTSHYTYLELPENLSAADFEKHFSEYMYATFDKDFAERRSYFLQPISDIYLHSHLSDEIAANGDITYVSILAIVGLVILSMASINYMGLATARLASRAKEVGIRKVVGAGPRQLVQQFLGESILMALIGLFLAVLIVEGGLPFVNDLTGKTLALALSDPLTLAGLVVLAILVGMLSGCYPAIMLAAFESITMLKGTAMKGVGGLGLRKVLVISQFTLSIILITCTLIIANQLRYMQNKKLGINPSLVVAIPLQRPEIASQFENIKAELLRRAQITAVTASNQALTSRIGSWREYEPEGHPETVMIPTIIVAHDFFTTLEGEVVDGRTFSRDFPSDASGAYVINEAAARFLDFKDPVGKALKGRAFTGSQWSTKDAQIIGVVKDFHFASLHSEIQPVVFSLLSEQTRNVFWMSVRINGSGIPATLAYMEETWKAFVPDRPFQFSFMDDNVHALYQSERRFFNIFVIFATLAIIINCLGVFGLSVFMAAQRTKEIGIRKVLGASTGKIMGLLTSDLLKLVLLANLIAAPIAYFAMKSWLSDFAYRTEIGFLTFIGAGLMALTVALLTVGYKVVRAALANPINSLRYE